MGGTRAAHFFIKIKNENLKPFKTVCANYNLAANDI